MLKGIYDDPAKREAYYNWPLFNSDDAWARLEVLSGLAKDLGVTNNQLVLAWLLHHRPRVIPILGPRTMEQLEQSLAALDIRLADKTMDMLNRASA